MCLSPCAGHDLAPGEVKANTIMATTTSRPEAINLETLGGKYLTFTLGREFYGIPVLKIREIIRMIAITPVPRMPTYFKGVINLRGKIIPVVDPRIKFNLAENETTEHTCIIVVQAQLASGTSTQMGLIVDSVEEVLNIAPTEIEATPDFGAALDTDYLLGMAKAKGKVTALLDIDRLLNGEAVVQRLPSPLPAEA